MSIVILGVDLGKNSCSIVGVDAAGAIVTCRSMRRQTLIDYVLNLPACAVAMEACCGAHHLGRLFVARGHQVRLMSPEYMRPYVKAQKNDDRDAEGIARPHRARRCALSISRARSGSTFRRCTGCALAWSLNAAT